MPTTIIDPTSLTTLKSKEAQIIDFFKLQSLRGIHVWKKETKYYLPDMTEFQFKYDIVERECESEKNKSQVRYEVISDNLIGEGSFGEVYRIAGTIAFKVNEKNIGSIHYKEAGANGKTRLVKIQKKTGNPNQAELIMHEYKISRKTDLSAVAVDGSKKRLAVKKPTRDSKGNYYSVMKELKGIQLEQIIQNDLKNNPALTLGQRIDLTEKLLAALKKQITDTDVIHADIKPANILVDMKATPISVNIIDFGFSQDVKDATKMISGTPTFVAPEVWYNTESLPEKRLTTTVKSDVFSMARVIACLWGVDEKEYGSTQANAADITKNETPDYLSNLFTKGISEANQKIIKEMLTGMLQKNVEERLSIQQAIDRFKKVNITPLEVEANLLHEAYPDLKALVLNKENLTLFYGKKDAIIKFCIENNIQLYNITSKTNDGSKLLNQLIDYVSLTEIHSKNDVPDTDRTALADNISKWKENFCKEMEKANLELIQLHKNAHLRVADQYRDKKTVDKETLLTLQDMTDLLSDFKSDNIVISEPFSLTEISSDQQNTIKNLIKNNENKKEIFLPVNHDGHWFYLLKTGDKWCIHDSQPMIDNNKYSARQSSMLMGSMTLLQQLKEAVKLTFATSGKQLNSYDCGTQVFNACKEKIDNYNYVEKKHSEVLLELLEKQLSKEEFKEVPKNLLGDVKKLEEVPDKVKDNELQTAFVFKFIDAEKETLVQFNEKPTEFKAFKDQVALKLNKVANTFSIKNNENVLYDNEDKDDLESIFEELEEGKYFHVDTINIPDVRLQQESKEQQVTHDLDQAIKYINDLNLKDITLIGPGSRKELLISKIDSLVLNVSDTSDLFKLAVETKKQIEHQAQIQQATIDIKKAIIAIKTIYEQVGINIDDNKKNDFLQKIDKVVNDTQAALTTLKDQGTLLPKEFLEAITLVKKQIVDQTNQQQKKANQTTISEIKNSKGNNNNIGNIQTPKNVSPTANNTAQTTPTTSKDKKNTSLLKGTPSNTQNVSPTANNTTQTVPNTSLPETPFLTHQQIKLNNSKKTNQIISDIENSTKDNIQITPTNVLPTATSPIKTVSSNNLEPKDNVKSSSAKRNWIPIVGGVIGVIIGIALSATGYLSFIGVPVATYAFGVIGVATTGLLVGKVADYAIGRIVTDLDDNVTVKQNGTEKGNNTEGKTTKVKNTYSNLFSRLSSNSQSNDGQQLNLQQHDNKHKHKQKQPDEQQQHEQPDEQQKQHSSSSLGAESLNQPAP